MKNTCTSIIMRLFPCIALLWAVPIPPVQAQQSRDFGSLAMSGPDDIVILIAKNVLHPSTASARGGWVGYNVYRRAAGEQDFRKLNSTPIARANTLEEFNSISRGSAPLLANMLKTRGLGGLWDLIVKNDPKVVTLSLFDPNIREALGLLFRDRDVQKGVAYSYTVAMVDAAGKESERTPPNTATFGLNPNPLKGPLSVQIGADERTVTLRWKSNPADKTALGFNVYRAYSRDARQERLNDRPIVVFTAADSKSEAVASFADTTVYPGRALYYCVVARDFAGNESPREPLLEITPRDTMPPGIPQKVLVRTSGHGLTITWDRVEDEDVAGYRIYRSGKDADGPYERITKMPVPPDTGIYEDGSVSPDKQYFYEVTALDRSGNESARSARGFATYYDFRPPLAPQNIEAEVIPGGIRITWEQFPNPSIQGHVVYRAESMGGALSQVSPLILMDTMQFTDRDKRLSHRGSYWYLVQAVAKSGLMSPLSAPVVASPAPTSGPEAPLNINGFSDDRGNRLIWTPSPDNTTSGYVVERSVADKKPKWTALNSIPSASKQVTFTDTTAVRGATYLYRVRAVNSAGLQGDPSQSITLGVFTAPPLPPSALMATRSARGARIEWNPSREPSAAGYNVYRSAGRGGAVKLNAKPLSSSASFYEDNKVKKGALYLYSVSCVAADGREGSRSEPVQFTAR